MTDLNIIRALKPLLKYYPWSISAVVILGFLEALAEGLGIGLLLPFLYSLNEGGFRPEAGGWLGRVLNQAFATIPASDRLSVIPLCIFGFVLLKNALSYGHEMLIGWVGTRLTHYLRCKIFDQLLRVGICFIERSEAGELLNALGGETESASEALAALIDLVIGLCTALVFAALLLLISWQLTFLVVVALVFTSAMVQLVTRRVEALSQAGMRATEALWQQILEVFSSMRTVRAFGRELHEQEHFAEVAKRVDHISLQLHTSSALIQPVSEVLAAALLILIFFRTLQDPHNFPAVLVFLFILYRLHPQTSLLNGARSRLIAAKAPLEGVMSLIDPSAKPYTRSGPVAFQGLREMITFESVSFRYDPAEPPALRDVSLRILQGQLTALVGPSGAGKSTLIDLILRFYDPTEGAISVDHVPLQQLDLASWLHRIAVVSQDIHLFNATVRQNIAYGRLDATEQEITAAARQADAHEFICALPRGYDTKIGDQGAWLSAGQRQRIALARAIVRNPEILILDEATNALDSVSETVIQESLQKLRQGRTVIVVAHRLSTIKRADHAFMALAELYRKNEGWITKLPFPCVYSESDLPVLRDAFHRMRVFLANSEGVDIGSTSLLVDFLGRRHPACQRFLSDLLAYYKHLTGENGHKASANNLYRCLLQFMAQMLSGAPSIALDEHRKHLGITVGIITRNRAADLPQALVKMM
ncbi:MAG TPA: ABC transporter ATP-binding protein [Candidatus Binatia bacterium]|nr:ABC transporter ATP-binding protein [Candidatus Binatia bacterium]